jgi:molecular chaperone GrpE
MNDDQKLHEQADQSGAAGGEGAAPEPEGGSELDRLAELEKELEEVRQHALYAQAETHNVRRRLEQEKVNASAYAVTGFAREMLSVKDKLGALLAGIEATARELDAVFQRNGITRIDAMGVPLDPNRHQAMVEIPNEDAEPGTIVQEMQSGYMIKDRLLRPALVGVARKP